MKDKKLQKIIKQRAEQWYNIALENLQRQREAHAKKQKK